MQDNDNIYIGYDIGKGISRHSRLCQNSGKDNRRRPLQFTDDTIGELLKDGYKMNKMTGMYEKQTVYEGKKITLRVVKLKGNNKSSIYYTCTPKHNGRHTFIGFLTKGKNPLGKYPPCCFITDNFISNNKEKRKFNFNQLKDINEEMKRDKSLTYNEIYYILGDIIKVPNDRLALLPDILDFYLNTNNNHPYKIIQHILASMDETNGRCAILLPHGILNRISETKIREELIKADLVDTIISIGKNLFYNSPMEACVVICQKKKPENRKGKILMIDARDLVTRDSTMSYLTSEHIREISQLYTNYVIIEGRTNIAKATDLLGNKDCSMNVSLYVKRRYSSDALPIEQAIQAWELCSANTNTEVSSLIEML